MMDSWVSLIATIFVSGLASSGLWAYIQSRTSRHSASDQLLMGLAHERIVHVGSHYVNRGWLTYDEYNDFIKYLYQPYTNLKKNGMVEKVKSEVEKLPLKSGRIEKILEVRNASKQQDVR